MKKIYYLFFIFSVSICLFAQEKDNDDLTQKKFESERQERIRLWKEDSGLLLNIIKDLREYRSDYNDTQLQANFKKEEFSKKLRELNIFYKGKVIKLNITCIDDVIEENNGEFKVNYFIPNEGVNQIGYSPRIFFPEKQTMSMTWIRFNLIMVLKNKSEALKLQRGALSPLEGKIKSIKYYNVGKEEHGEIVLE